MNLVLIVIAIFLFVVGFSATTNGHRVLGPILIATGGFSALIFAATEILV